MKPSHRVLGGTLVLGSRLKKPSEQVSGGEPKRVLL